MLKRDLKKFEPNKLMKDISLLIAKNEIYDFKVQIDLKSGLDKLSFLGRTVHNLKELNYKIVTEAF